MVWIQQPGMDDWIWSGYGLINNDENASAHLTLAYLWSTSNILFHFYSTHVENLVCIGSYGFYWFLWVKTDAAVGPGNNIRAFRLSETDGPLPLMCERARHGPRLPIFPAMRPCCLSLLGNYYPGSSNKVKGQFNVAKRWWHSLHRSYWIHMLTFLEEKKDSYNVASAW